MLYRLLAASGLFMIAAWTLSCATAQNDSREITFAPGTGPIDKLAAARALCHAIGAQHIESYRLAEK